MSIIFDLDGTLIDASDRLYNLFCELIPECVLTKEQYWAYKRDKVNHKMLIEKFYPNHSFEEFNSKWMSLIEAKEYLEMDKTYKDTITVLEKLREKIDVYLLTARQSKKMLLDELQWLGLTSYFKQIMTTEGKYTKEEVLSIYCESDNSLNCKGNIFVSDMGKDILLGKKMGYRTIAISHGFMSADRLAEYEPDEMVESLSQILV